MTKKFRAHLLTSVVFGTAIISTFLPQSARAQANTVPQVEDGEDQTAGAALAPVPVGAGPEVSAGDAGEIVVTGSRLPGLASASPITSISSAEIRLQQTPEAEQLLRTLPASVPADGANVNFQTSGASTVNLRGLGAQRNLILLNGKRLVPFNVEGRVDVSSIPLAMIDRVDVVTGGASAVYGSDALSGVVNFVTRRNFNGADFNASYSVTGDGDGEVANLSTVFGVGLGDGRGSATLGLSYSERHSVIAGDRPFGEFGIVTRTGQNFGASAPLAPPAGCGGPNVVAAGGSSWTLPTWMILSGSPLGQYREDGTLGGLCLGNSPSLYNSTPINYLQTPQEKYSILAVANYELTDTIEAYTTGLYSHTLVNQLVSPSGVIGNLFWTPMSNPLIGDQARSFILGGANARRAAGALAASNWRDLNSNGVVDAPDDLLIQYFRRMPEVGNRRGVFENNTFQLMAGLRGQVFGWDWDASLQHGESSRREIRSGHVNVPNIADAVQAIPGANGSPVCRSQAPGCVPLDLWGGFGSITPAMLPYIRSVAVLEQFYAQDVATGTFGGPINALTSPFADTPVSASIGVEYREESGKTIPDQCIRNAPASCQGGPNTLPISGGYNVAEVFAESVIPLIAGRPLLDNLSLELGYRYSDYNRTGVNETWKVGLNWDVTERLRLRAMRQRAARAPNVGELAAPVTSAIGAARLDPCSIANAAALAGDATLRQRCIDTGVSAGLVGVVPNLTAGQIFTFIGTDAENLPKPETGDTTTIGLVWSPPLLQRTSISLDYYNIKIRNYIGARTAQEVLEDCYTRGNAVSCAKIRRDQGALLSFNSGVELFTTNLDRLRAEGIELNVSTRADLANIGLEGGGDLEFSFNGNLYLTRDSRSNPSLANISCLGRFGATCGNPTPETRFVQRTTWSVGDLQLSYLWRHLGKVRVEQAMIDAGQVFPAFQKIKAQNYFDLTATWELNRQFRLSASVNNVFDNDPPLVGNEAGTVQTNFANTFPSVYDTLGRVFTFGANLRF